MHGFLAYSVRYARKLYSKKQRLFATPDKTYRLYWQCRITLFFFTKANNENRISIKKSYYRVKALTCMQETEAVSSESVQLKAIQTFRLLKAKESEYRPLISVCKRELSTPAVKVPPGDKPWHWRHRKAVPWDLQASHVSSGPRVSAHFYTALSREHPAKKDRSRR